MQEVWNRREIQLTRSTLSYEFTVYMLCRQYSIWMRNIVWCTITAHTITYSEYLIYKYIVPSENRGVFRNLSRGVVKFFSFQGGAQHLLGYENPLKSIDFTGQGGGGLAPIAPLNTPLAAKHAWSYGRADRVASRLPSISCS